GGLERVGEGASGLVVVLSFEPGVVVTNLLAREADVCLERLRSSEEMHQERPQQQFGGSWGSTPLAPDSCPGLPQSLQATTGQHWTRTIARGRGVSCLHCPPGQDVKLSVKVKGFGWSTPVPVPLQQHEGFPLSNSEETDLSSPTGGTPLNGRPGWAQAGGGASRVEGRGPGLLRQNWKR
ncbi:unnamed protein product, partial [Choristocarpus tenellus]